MSTDKVLRDVAVQDVRNAVVTEMYRAVEMHGWFVSKHHALGVLLEEWDELKETITHDESPERIYEEAIQVSAMAMEIAVMYGPTVIDNPNHTPPPSGAVTAVPEPLRSTGQPGALKRIFVYPLLRRLFPSQTANSREKPGADHEYEWVCPYCEGRVTMLMSQEEFEYAVDNGGWRCPVSRLCNELMQPVEENTNA
ncbi:hypothetical protein LCGC14_0423430 [marine sediment metagenome]|uniref:Uncharacterized protein n=1 Tax=marine sediment metagenome TaxID=412755 RepID=A0A0F9SQ74_9ZZZZ